MDDIGLIDVFRRLNPNERSFSYESRLLKVSSRTDFYLESKSITNWVVKANTKVSSKRGPGLWKFNNSLVTDDGFVKLIKQRYPVIREKYLDLKDDRLK